MTSRERLLRIFSGELPDRPAVRLWGAWPDRPLLHPAYEPIHRLAMQRTDVIVHIHPSFNVYWGAAGEEICEVEKQVGGAGEWVDVVTRVHTPAGVLTSLCRRTATDDRGYELEFLIKEPEDIARLLSVPYRPDAVTDEAYCSLEKSLGDRGVAMLMLAHAASGLQRAIGPENFAVWSVTHRDLLLEAIADFSRRIRDHALAALRASPKRIVGWAGPEVCIPPLMSPADFEEFVFRFDKPLVDLAHEHRARVWVHCHGRMDAVLERFVDMGVDVLNPLEPPPMGDLPLKEAFARVRERMGIEGNVETHDLMTASKERVAQLVAEAIEAGRGRRFILCPSSGYMASPCPSARLLENLRVFIEEGVRHAERCFAP